MQMIQGYRNKLSALCDITKLFKILVEINGISDYDFSFFGLDANNQLKKEEYMIFYNQLESPNKEMILELQKNKACITVNLNSLPPDIQKLTSTISIDGEGTMNQIQSCKFCLIQNNQELASLCLNGEQFNKEKAIIGLELYLKDNQWRINAVGKGFDGGLKALLESFGGTAIEEEPHIKNSKVSLEKKLEKAPSLVSLAKPIKLALEKFKIQDIVAKVAIVIDISGSMTKRYQNGTVQEIIEKTLPLAIQFDDDGQMDCWYFGTTCKKMNDINLDNYKTAVPQDWRNLMSYLGGSNNEPVVMREVLEIFKDSVIPVYVLFISDGGVHNKGQIKSIMKDASLYPIFWQFMGIGGSNYGILEQLDTMSGRVVDNAGFFAIDDFKQLSNEEIYNRLLSEFPIWLKKAKELRIIR